MRGSTLRSCCQRACAPSSSVVATLAHWPLLAALTRGVPGRRCRAGRRCARTRSSPVHSRPAGPGVRGFLIESIGPAGRHDPLPTQLVLVEDASRREGFVSLRADIVAVGFAGSGTPSKVVSRSTSTDRPLTSVVTAWRAGRILEAPDHVSAADEIPERRRARLRARSGTRRCHASRHRQERPARRRRRARRSRIRACAPEVRAHVRRAVGRWIEPHGSVSAGDCICCADWRSHRACPTRRGKRCKPPERTTSSPSPAATSPFSRRSPLSSC